MSKQTESLVAVKRYLAVWSLALVVGVSLAGVAAARPASRHHGHGHAHVRRHPRARAASARTWHVLPTPALSGLAVLNGVSCASTTSCVAVGRIATGPSPGVLVEQWDGATWTVVPTPTTISGGQLNGVSCVSATSCVAVGSYSISTATTGTLVEQWDGSMWTIVPTPGFGAGISTASLQAVSCTASTACMAVGSYHNPVTLDTFALAERWDGATWQIQPGATPRGFQPAGFPAPVSNSFLYGVSCSSSRACVAVGSYNVLFSTTFIESWNGSTWEIQSNIPGNPPQHTGTVNGGLAGVSCVAVRTCIAVGTWSPDDANSSPFAVRQNGSASWQAQTSAIFFTPHGGLAGISCASATYCSGAGPSDAANGNAPQIYHWNGSAWETQSTPSLPGQLIAISCHATTLCVAVGDVAGATLAEGSGDAGTGRSASRRTSRPQRRRWGSRPGGVSEASGPRIHSRAAPD